MLPDRVSNPKPLTYKLGALPIALCGPAGPSPKERGGWSGGAKVLGKLPVPGRPTIWITVGQGPIALTVGAGGGWLEIFTLIYPFFPFSLRLWETARYRLKYCLRGPLNSKPSNPKRGRQRRERTDESKNVQTAPPAPTTSAAGPCPTVIQIVGRPGTGKLPRAVAPPDHPSERWRKRGKNRGVKNVQTTPTRTYCNCNRPLPYSYPNCTTPRHWRGWSGGAMVLGELPVPERPTIWITVGQGPTAFTVGADGGCLVIFTLLCFLSYFSLSPGDGPI